MNKLMNRLIDINRRAIGFALIFLSITPAIMAEEVLFDMVSGFLIAAISFFMALYGIYLIDAPPKSSKK